MALDLNIKNNAICRFILKKISKFKDQISLRWQLTSVHSKFVGHSTEFFWQSKIKGPLSLFIQFFTQFMIFFFKFQMRIPVEHFSTIPVFALSPMNSIESQSKRIELDQSLAPNNNNTNGSRKISLPTGLAFNSSVGSAPNSPKNSPKSSKENLNEGTENICSDEQPSSLVPTISGKKNIFNVA